MARPLIPTCAALALLAAALVAPPATASDISACAAASYHPADQSPFGGEAVPPLRPVSAVREVPPGFRLSRVHAVEISSRTDAAREELGAPSAGAAEVRTFTQGPC